MYNTHTALFMVVMGCSHAVYYVSFILVWFLAILQTTDAVASVTWYEPPPVETVTDLNLIQTHNKQLREGSINELLNWNFSVSLELNLILVTIKLDGNTAATIVPSTGVAGVDGLSKNRFNVSWISQYATLIIFNVTVADEGVFSCELNTFEGAENKVWKRNIQVTVVDPPSITDISGNQTVTVGDVVTVICTANGRPTPNITWTRLSDNSVVTFPLTITGLEDEGAYRCTADNGIGNPVSRNVSVIVQIPPHIANVSSDQDHCEGSLVTMSCNATGKPAPNITWTRAFDNGTDSAPLLPVVDGKYTMNNIMRSSNGTYRCTADNKVRHPVNHTVKVTVRYSASVVRIVNSSNTVNEGGPFNMTCEATGDPKPKVCWIEEDNGQCIDGNILNFTNINRNDTGQFRCDAENNCGNDSKVQSIDVYYRPNITYISENRRVNQSETVNLTCTAYGNPSPSITWTRVSDNSAVKFSLIITGKKDEGVYRCTASNGVGDPDTAEFFIDVQNYGPFGTQLTTNLSDNTAVLNKSFDLNCSAQANPTAKYRFYKEQESLFNTTTSSYFAVTTASVSDRIEEVNFSCTPFNEYGGGFSAVIIVTVHYAPLVNPKNKKINITRGNTARYKCPVDGNPPPNVTWYEGTDIGNSVLPDPSGNELVIENLQLDKSYTCLARNDLGEDTGSVYFVVGEKSTPNANSSVEATWKVENKNYDQRFEVGETMNETMSQAVKPVGELDNFSIVKYGPGSVIVDFLLRFSQSVSASDVISALKTAAKEGKFGDLIIDPDSIRQGKTPSPTTETVTMQVPVCTNPSFIQDDNCETKMWLVIVCVVAGVIVFAVVIALVTCMVYKRRKCRKDRKTHPPDDQEELQGNQSGADENAYSHVNGGYADSGPPSANGTDAGAQQPREGANGTDATGQQQLEQQVQGAPPTYAVVDKSTKKKKKEEEKKKKEEEKRKKEKEKKMKEEEKKNRNDSEQNIPQYAVVDKSQKKKKEVVEDAYAQVDMSKKSKKQKPKPGEMLYADLGEFQPRQMPAVSTSPAPLPPIKRPPAYEETQYADITQFLTGNATLPDANNSQGTEMTSANVEGGKEKPENTANEGGKEEKPKETRM